MILLVFTIATITNSQKLLLSDGTSIKSNNNDKQSTAYYKA